MAVLAALVGGMASARGEEEGAELLSFLEEQTRIATRTRVNVDYVPGILTVLHQSDLLALGVRTLWEALALVPGVQLTEDETGNKQLLVRGGNSVYNSGNVKFLLDGVALNSQLNAEALALYDLSLHDVERIEVIRGPGSAIHGEYAYLGVVNVVTVKSGNNAGLGAGNALGGWARVSHEDPASGVRASLGLHAEQGDNSLNSGADSTGAMGLADFSHAPGDTNEPFRNRSLLLNLAKGELHLQAGAMESAKGDQFGINLILPPDNRIVDRNATWFANAGHTWTPSNLTEIGLEVGWQRHERHRDELYLGPGEYFGTEGGAYFMDLDYREESFFAKLNTTYTGFQDHTLFGELSWGHTRIIDSSWFIEGFELPATWIDPDMARTVLSLALQDEFLVRPDVTLTLGGRYDSYDDVGDNLSPRIAAVWRITPAHVVKLQYGEAFRPSTFYEMRFGSDEFGNGAITSQTSRNVDLGYIHRDGPNTARVTLYASELNDLIVFDSTVGYTNIDGARLHGVELEAERHLTRALRTLGNLSLAKTENRDTGAELAGSAGVMGNLALIWQATDELTLAPWLRYVGDRHRDSADTRDKLPDILAVDLTSTWKPARLPVTLRLGVKNLLDDDIIYLAPYEDGATYAEDFPRPGRMVWGEVGVSW